MIFHAFSVVLVLSAAVALFSSRFRTMVLGLWCVGVSASGLFLAAGYEVLAAIQLIISTLSAGVMFLHGLSFGDFESRDTRSTKDRVLSSIPAWAIGLAFGWLVWMGLGAGFEVPVVSEQGLEKLGWVMVTENYLTLLSIAMGALLVLVGAGVVSRREEEDR